MPVCDLWHYRSRQKKGLFMSSLARLTLDCAPKIWKKLSVPQQDLWCTLNSKFYYELEILSKCGKKEQTVSGNLAVVAHNLACEAVWELARQKIIEGRKPAHNSAKPKPRKHSKVA